MARDDGTPRDEQAPDAAPSGGACARRGRYRRILVIDPRAAGRDNLRAVLARGPDGFHVDAVPGGNEGVVRTRAAGHQGRPFAMAFLSLPPSGERSRAEVIRRLWREDPDLQIVVCSDEPAPSWAELTAEMGESDRLVLLRPPLDPTEVWQLASSLSEKALLIAQARLKLGELEELVERRTRELRHANDRLQREVTERQAVEEQLRFHAYHDTLTGLANRGLLMERLEQRVALSRRRPDCVFAVVFLDIDNFKVINDSLGHEIGDELLVAVTQRLESCLRNVDTMATRDDHVTARLGGDEFVLLLDGLRKPTDVIPACERLLRVLSRPFELQGQEVVISASIGVATSNPDYDDPTALLRDADIAMYRSKAAGKSRFTIFDREMHVQALERLALENDLRRALAREQFHLVYQPIVALATEETSGVEALLRWDHPERGLVSPDVFIPVAEETGLITEIGWWVLGEACRQLAAWDRADLSDPPVSMNVNISRRQLLDGGLYEEVLRQLSEHRLDGTRLNLEITESAVIEDNEAAATQLRRLRSLGVRIHMDDFGTGYSSLSCLHRFPLDVVKIDRAFMATMGADRDYAAVVHGIITIAHNLNMKVTAEGVETRDQLAQILALACDYAQGYHFSRPVSAAEAMAYLRAERRTAG